MMIIVNKLAKAVYGDELYATPGVDWSVSCTGKTTAKILAIISEALANPGKKVQITEGKDPIIECRPGGIVDQTGRIIKQLGLRFAKINYFDNTLVFHIFEKQQEAAEQVNEVQLLKAKLVEAAYAGDLGAVTTYSQAIQRIQAVN